MCMEVATAEKTGVMFGDIKLERGRGHQAGLQLAL